MKEPTLISNFMQGSLRGAKITREQPEQAFESFVKFSRRQDTKLNKKIYYHALPFISKDLTNTERDWQRVCNYASKIDIVDKNYDYTQCFTNSFLN